MDRSELKKPYWAAPDDKDVWPGLDFNRELVSPGTNENFPCGAVGIRIDGDFWQVAALPWSWRHYPLPEIVRALWPSRADQAEYGEDVAA